MARRSSRPPPLLCPGLRAVVRRCSQDHSERQLLVTPVHPQPSPTLSPCNTSTGLHARLIHGATRKKKNGYATCLSLVVVVVVLACDLTSVFVHTRQ